MEQSDMSKDELRRIRNMNDEEYALFEKEHTKYENTQYEDTQYKDTQHSDTFQKFLHLYDNHKQSKLQDIYDNIALFLEDHGRFILLNIGALLIFVLILKVFFQII